LKKAFKKHKEGDRDDDDGEISMFFVLR